MNTNAAKKHLPRGNNELPSACPSAHLWPIACPCAGRSLTCHLPPNHGPALILVPAKLIGNWIREWNSLFHDPDTPDPEAGHAATCAAMTLLVGHSHKYTNAVKLDDTNKSLLHGQVKFKNYSCDETKPMFRPSGSVKMNSDHSRVAVVTSPQSFSKRVYSFLARPMSYDDPDGPELKNAVHWSRVIRDEAHEEKNGETQGIKIFQGGHSVHGSPFRWALSGTPFELSPRDIIEYVRPLEHNWDRYVEDDISRCTVVRIENIALKFKQSFNKPRSPEYREAVADFQVVLQQLFIRRITETKWFGKDLVKLPPHEHKDINLDIPAEYDSDVRAVMDEFSDAIDARIRHALEQEKQGPSQTLNRADISRQLLKSTSLGHFARISSTFPCLARFATNRRNMLTGQACKDNKWYTDFQSSPFNEFFSEIIKSPKMEKLGELLFHPVSRKPKKTVIVSYFPIVALIVYRVSLSLNPPLLPIPMQLPH